MKHVKVNCTPWILLRGCDYNTPFVVSNVLSPEHYLCRGKDARHNQKREIIKNLRWHRWGSFWPCTISQTLENVSQYPAHLWPQDNHQQAGSLSDQTRPGWEWQSLKLFLPSATHYLCEWNIPAPCPYWPSFLPCLVYNALPFSESHTPITLHSPGVGCV